MAVVLDTGILYAYYDRSDRWHRRATELIRSEGERVIPTPVIPEVDHLLGRRLGAQARTTFYQGLAGDWFFLADLPAARYARVAELDRQFADLELGFVDAAVAAIAEGMGIPRIATTDRRDFVPVAAALAFELLPEPP